MDSVSKDELNSQISMLQLRLEEAEQLIDSIRQGEVDAFAINSGNQSEVFTLQSSDYAYRMLVEMIGEGAANITDDGVIVFANQYLVDLLQMPHEKLLGADLNNFIHENSIDQFTVMLAESRSGKSKGEIDLIVNGKIVPVYISMASLNLSLPTTGIIITDLTEKKRNEKNLAAKTADLISANKELIDTKNFLDNVLSSTDHGVCSFLAVREKGELVDMTIAYANEKALDQINYPSNQVIGNSYLKVFTNAKEIGAWQRIQRVLSTKKSESHEITLPGNVERAFLVHYVPFDDGVTCTFIEITDQKNQARLLEEKNSELVRNNAELASFAYIASHDLQEPLRKIQTFAARILEKEFKNLSEYGQDYFKRMEAAAHRMQTLIEDLLSYSRTNSMERKFEKTDVAKIIRSLKIEMREEIQQKNATIESPETLMLMVIPFQFKQLMYNLISNSLKFASPDRKPVIKIKAEYDSGSKLNDALLNHDQMYCHIELSDNGIGFEQEYSDRIFQLFKRLHLKSEYSGTGIGLAIVKKIVENHGGIINAFGKQHEGATFHIYIPDQE